jgi:two-component system response regulator
MNSNDIQPARILVIEDSIGDITVLRHALDEHQEAYEIEVLRDGSQALAFCAEQRTFSHEPRPCVIVLDLHLPKHDGFAVLEAIKQAPALAHIHVVALSSFSTQSDKEEVRALGVRLYREKPLDLDAWIALAAEILAICRESTAVRLV